MARVLVIDDSPTAFRFAERTLCDSGHDVELLSAFTHLASTLDRFQPDVILLDLQMPAMSGESMGAFIRRYQRRAIPVVIYSGQNASQIATAAQVVGAAASIPKSADRELLCRTIEEVLSRSGRRSRRPSRRASPSH